ncbi:hypothetical protein [Thalassospira australica]|uniref:hypothetical protein n=1 Tax=Thalassospira australica TaxID=1528106 RepID=UPI00384B1B9C
MLHEEVLKDQSVQKWLLSVIGRHEGGVFEKLQPAIIWTNAKDENDNLLVALDPYLLTESINSSPYPLYEGHDPGYPIGRLIEAKLFEIDDVGMVVVGLLGVLGAKSTVSFAEIGFDTKSSVDLPSSLPDPPTTIWIDIISDPREVDVAWIEKISGSAPFPVKISDSSHNAAEVTSELISIGVWYALLVFNPFVTSIASEAGKDTYIAFRKWILGLLKSLSEHHDPILCLKSNFNGCEITLMFRGNDVSTNYSAHDKSSQAAVQAAQLIEHLLRQGLEPIEVVYEFDADAYLWFPSYVSINDGRIITDRATLIAFEQISGELSLGFNMEEFAGTIKNKK